MSIFIKLSKDCNSIYVVKTKDGYDEITEEEFCENAEKMALEKFIKKYSKIIDEEMLMKKVKAIREIVQLGLHKFGSEVKEANDGKKIRVYHVGNKTFSEGIDDDEKMSAKEKAIQLGYLIFGKKFMEDNIHYMREDILGCFRKNESEYNDFYESVKEEEKQLLSIFCIYARKEKKLR